MFAGALGQLRVDLTQRRTIIRTTQQGEYELLPFEQVASPPRWRHELPVSDALRHTPARILDLGPAPARSNTRRPSRPSRGSRRDADPRRPARVIDAAGC